MRRALILLLFLFCTAPGPALAAWLEGRSPHFTVYSDGNEGELRAALSALENHRRVLRQLTRITPAPGAPLNVYLVASREKVAEAVGEPLDGVHIRGAGDRAVLVVRGGSGGVGGERVLRHEYTHAFMAGVLAYHPPWHTEGFAEYVMAARVRGNRAELGLFDGMRLWRLSRGNWLPMERLLFGRRPKPEEEAQFYAQSALLVHYLFADPKRRAALAAYLATVTGGAEPRAAFRRTFGHDARTLEAELRRYHARGPASSILMLDAAPALPVVIRRLPASADRLLLPHLALRLELSSLDIVKLSDQVRREAARHPDDPYARRVLARAEIADGNRGEGVRLTGLLLKAAPKDAELLFARGLADYVFGLPDPALRRKRLTGACPWFARAQRADPSSYAIAYRLAECELFAGSEDKALAYLLLAHAQAPMFGTIAVDAAALLAKRGRRGEARRMLTPVAANPQAAAGRRAREMLESLAADRGR